MKKERKFSLKKYLLTNLITVMATCFIGIILLFIDAVNLNVGLQPNVSVYNDMISNKQKYEVYEDFLERTKNRTDSYIEEDSKIIKEIYGKEYNPNHLIFANILYIGASSLSKIIIVGFVYFISLGIVLGNAIYFIFIQNTKGKKLIVKSIFPIGMTTMIIYLLDYLYNCVINNRIKEWSNISENLFNDKLNLLPLLLIFIFITIITWLSKLVYDNYLVDIFKNIKANKKKNSK